MDEKSFKARVNGTDSPKSAYAKANIHAKGKVGKLARLAYVAQGVHGSGKASMNTAGDNRGPASKLYQIG